MKDTKQFVEFDVELSKADVDFLDQEAIRLSYARNDLICRAVDVYLDRFGELFAERDEGQRRKRVASRTEHGAKKPPTTE